MSSEPFQAPRGTHDVLPADANWWGLLERIENTLHRYGWRPIQTPGFEDTRLFARTSGEASDVVHKEMYTFDDRSGRSLTLRPEGTAPIARAYVEHGLHRDPQPVKAYTVAPMYRYGRPGRGRYREHYQFSVEAIGSADPAIDAEVIEVYSEILRQVGVTQWELHLNSIGDAACRPAYVERLNAWLDEHLDLLGEEALHKRATSPLQVFDVKDPALRAALDGAPKIGDSLCDECRAHFAEVCTRLDRLSVPYVHDPTLVRGLDYYTRTTFEFMGPEANANSVICGGGRYDGLVEQIGGPPTPGIGFGAGIERLLLALENENVAIAPSPIDVFVVNDGAEPTAAHALLQELRRAGVAADMDFAGRSVKGQLTQGSRSGAATLVVLRAGEAVIRRAGSPDETVGLAEVAATLTP
ncbi:MAG TPA: histidine--tRNA ligase [Gaiellaceae bacterium]|nr:histidine--tRNA ligase [Gaiellaceae bacterium]